MNVAIVRLVSTSVLWFGANFNTRVTQADRKSGFSFTTQVRRHIEVLSIGV